MADFASLRKEYSRFYDIRNHPAEGVEFEEWQQLPDTDVSVWADKMQKQAEIVSNLIGALSHMKPDRAYHELTCYFHEDTKAIQRGLKARNIELAL